MKFSIEQRELIAALASAKSIVKKTVSIPILENVLLSASDMGLHIASTDMNMRVEMNVECDAVEIPGNTTVSASKLFDITRRLSADKLINIQLDGDVLLVKQGRSRFKLRTLPFDSFPHQLKIDPYISVDVDANELKRLLSKTIHAASSDVAKLALNGVYLHVSDGKVNSCATDGYQLSHIVGQDIDVVFDGFIIPKDAAASIVGHIEEVDVTVNVGKGGVSVNCGDVTISTKYIDATYPQYERIIPKNDLIVRTGKEELFSAISKVRILADGKNRRVSLTIKDNNISVLGVGVSNEEAIDQIDCEFSGDTSISFNSDYLIATLSQLKDGIIIIELDKSPKAPAVFKQDGVDSETFIVMPQAV